MRGDAIVYVGDGATDRCPASLADVVFATGFLADSCTRKGIPFFPYETFGDVQKRMSEATFVEHLEAEAGKDVGRKTTLPGPEEENSDPDCMNPYHKMG